MHRDIYDAYITVLLDLRERREFISKMIAYYEALQMRDNVP